MRTNMLRRVQSALVGSNRARPCAAAAVAAGASAMLVAASRQTSPEQDDEETKKDVNTAHSSICRMTRTVDPVQIIETDNKRDTNTSFFPLSTSRCESASSLIESERHDSIRDLQRSRTLRRMDLHSTKGRTLESRYDVDLNGPPLGVGAFGSVYKATDKATNEKVALKKISKEFTDDDSFQREMRALLHIRSCGGHPNICAMRENFDYDGNYCLILDFIGGGEMFDHLSSNGAYSEADAARLVREVASALAFLHGIGVVHADLKPENLMLSTGRRADAVVKLVDFGSAEVLVEDEIDAIISLGSAAQGPNLTGGSGVVTPAYCPPESFRKRSIPRPTMDMWSLGVILYIMLTGVHPFDLNGRSTDAEVEDRIKNPRRYTPPIRNSPITEHLSESALTLIEQLLQRNPRKRLTADEMLDHPWVRGETAKTDIIAGSDERLNKFRVFKSKLQARFFQDVVTWSDNEDETRRKTSLIERSFRSFDTNEQGFLTTKDLGQNFDGGALEDNTDEGGESLSMSDFHNLLSENMKDRYFPRGHIVYHEGDIGNHMYFINSGTVAVTTKDGSRATRNQGDFFGEGALLHPKRIRSATIRCKTPVHAMEISREYFEKYLAGSESGLFLTLKEKDKIRKRNRAKTILRLQKTLQEVDYDVGEYLFKLGDDGDSMFILESGRVDVIVQGRQVFSVTPGNVCGEHSVLTGRPRNCSAVCSADEGCIAQKLSGTDFRKLMELSPNIKDSLLDLCRRRDFKKAVVFRLGKEFPYRNPKEAFDAADKNKSGVLDLNDVKNLLLEMDPDYSDAEIREVIKSLDLTNSGTVSFDEFKKVFVADIRTSASM